MNESEFDDEQSMIDYQIEMYWFMIDCEDMAIFIKDVIPETTDCPKCELLSKPSPPPNRGPIVY